MKIDYKFRWNKIKKFVDFSDKNVNQNLKNNELTRANKRMISVYYKRLYSVGGQPGILSKSFQLYRPRNQKRKKQALEYAQAKDLKRLKAIPIPSPAKRKVKLKFDSKDELISVGDSKVERIIEFFDKAAFVKNPSDEIDRILRDNPKITQWAPLTGRFQSRNFYSRKTIKNILFDFIETSGGGNLDKSSDWLIGLAGFKFSGQSTFKQYTESLNRSRTKALTQSAQTRGKELICRARKQKGRDKRSKRR